jgi:predicted MFS family arabinose efflux permease
LHPADSSDRTRWAMLLALVSGFALSQAFRTVAAIMAPPLQAEFHLTPSQLGVFAGAFHFAFGGLQLFMGMGMDLWGPRRTVLVVSPLTIVGAIVAATAHSYPQLIVGQVIIGVGCAPAFLACTIAVSRWFEPQRFAAVNGAAMGIGTVGLLVTGTPLAWVIEQWSWRAGFLALAVLAVGAWLAIFLLVRDGHQVAEGAPARPLDALRGYGELLRLPFTWGIVVLALFTYASFLTFRGLWLGPMLVERHGFSLVQTGNVALVFSFLSAFGPPLYGRIDPGDARRRRWLFWYTLGFAALFVVMALTRSVLVDLLTGAVVMVLCGYMVMQYADVRAAYPARLIGRAMALFTMALFMGVALMQWITGLVANSAPALGMETYQAVLGSIALLLVGAAIAFRLLPAPRR